MTLPTDTCGDTLAAGTPGPVGCDTAAAGAAQEAPDLGQWEGQDVLLVRPSLFVVKGGMRSSQRYLSTYLEGKPCRIDGTVVVVSKCTYDFNCDRLFSSCHACYTHVSGATRTARRLVPHHFLSRDTIWCPLLQ